MAVLLALTLAGTATTLLLPAALGRALDQLLTGSPGATRAALLCAALTAAQVAVSAVASALAGTTDAHAAALARHRLLGHVLAVGPAADRRFGPGDLTTRSTVNAAHAGTAPAALASLAATLLTPLGGILALALLDWRLAAAFLVGLPALALLLRSFARSSADAVARYQDLQSGIAGRLVETLGGARTVAAAGTERRERDRVLASLPDLAAQGHRMWRVNARATGQAALLGPFLQLAVLAAGGLLLSGGHLSVGGLLAAARYAVLATGVGVFVGHLNRLVHARAAARRLGDVLALPPVPHGRLSLPPAGDGSGRLEFHGVTAGRGGRPLLRGLDLTVPAGATLAVVGRSGTGKSLLAELAGRLTDPDAGCVLLDGTDLRDLDRATLRREVGYAFERPALLGATIGEAIALGPVPPSAAAVAAAAASAHADGFIHTLPDGYDTPRAGAPLSGGELQRLGLARAFVHHRRLLILDDATSSLDTVTEMRVGAALMARGHARTRLIVAHRPASAARADLVAWLDGGRIRALGPHRDLWDRDGAYRAMWRTGENGDG
ncbi:ABC transporter ATP-binding protein [Streptomyces sp. SBT349]|uniref:ABC transporter ATP-binding protein n=1 Tax=Streptomyces sp. SBT349 TaxID=1580539 RepID=UPI002D2192E0|nr:ABC transporter ATP-binding protein [Streptomyces sp. SBT349]